MNILLDAYFDGNFGDDVFVQCITSRFSNYKFYTFLEYYPEEVCDWAESIPNLFLLPECNVFLRKNMFDAYVCVGGDIFPDKGNYDKRKGYVKSVKECGGVVAYIGFSLFHTYSEETKQDICELMEQADLVAPRDRVSTELLKNWLPHKEIFTMADLAFSYFERGKNGSENKEILGISVRKPGNVSEEVLERYCVEMAGVINAFLDKDNNRQVRIFSLSKGVWNDTEITGRILNMVQSPDRVEHYVYEGETQSCYQAIAECKVMISTRLHAMVAAIALGIKCIPVIYEVKQEHILKEIVYKGVSFAFHNLQGISDYVEDLWIEQNKQWQTVDLEKYLEKSKEVLNRLNNLLESGIERSAIYKFDSSGAQCEEKQYAKTQVAEVLKKNKELEDLAASMEELQHTIQNCQSDNERYLQELESCNKRNEEYFGIIETQNHNYQKMEQVKDEYIHSLNEEKNRLDKVIVEKQQEENRLNQLIEELKTAYESIQLRNQQLDEELLNAQRSIVQLEQDKLAVQQACEETQETQEALQATYEALQERHEVLQATYEALQPTHEALLEEHCRLKAECEKLTQREAQYTEILDIIRPYFMSGKGSFITKKMSELLEMKEKGSKDNWEKIQKFYE